MPAPERTAQSVFGERAAFYTTSPAHTDPQVLERLIQLAGPEPGWQALDVGTGSGHTALALAPHVAWVTGTDITPEMLAEANGLRDRRGITNVTYTEADVHELPFDDESFDLVTCRRAAHHFTSITRALSEMCRVLRPGGRLVIDDRSVPDDEFVDACMNRLDFYHDESHVRQYPPGEWEIMLNNAGFSIDAIETYTRHRPLTSLTEGVSAANVEKMNILLDGLSAEQRAALNLTEIDGKRWINHWYIMLAGWRP